MAEETGNWFTGYSGRSDYNPSSYAMKTGRFFRDKASARTDQMDAGQQRWALEQMQGNAFGPLPSGPSAAELQMQRGMQDRQNAAFSLLGNSGMNPALARRRALQAQEQAMGDFQGQSGILRAQEEAQRRAEQMQAQGMYAQLLGGMRGQNQQMSEADRQALMQLEQMNLSQSLGLNQLRMQQDIGNAQGMKTGGFLGPLLGAAATAGSGAMMAFGGKPV